MAGESRLTYLDLERLVIRARTHGQEGLAFHLAMGRDVLLAEEFGSAMGTKPRMIEALVAEEYEKNERLRAIARGDEPGRGGG